MSTNQQQPPDLLSDDIPSPQPIANDTGDSNTDDYLGETLDSQHKEASVAGTNNAYGEDDFFDDHNEYDGSPHAHYEPSSSFYEGASVEEDPEAVKGLYSDTDTAAATQGDDYLGGAYDEEQMERDHLQEDDYHADYHDQDTYLGGHYKDAVDEDGGEEGVFVNNGRDDDHRPGIERQSGFRARNKKRFAAARADPERRRRWKWGCSVFWCILCLFILVLLLILAKFLGWFENEAPPPEDDNPYLDDDDFVISKPYPGKVTTGFEPYVKDDCNFDDQTYPSIVNQCYCRNELQMVPNDTKALYFKIREDVDQEIYGGDYDQEWNSCAPSNMALIWLSSGNMRDNGDLYQRFLLALSFFQLNGTKWDQLNNWVEEESECNWFGVQCNGRFKLRSLAIDMNNVQGELPTEMARLDGLQALAITRNHLGNTIPPEFFGMPKLESLMLYANNLRGSIPREVAQATQLTTLRLENNLFFGQLVTEIGLLTNLEEFSIGFNNFWRKIPTEIGLLTNMRWLVMEDNRLSGTLISEITKLTKLEYFLISSNLMRGPIPEGFSRLTDLQEFRLAHTGLGGTIPQEFAALNKLHRLEMGFNNFEGTLMTEFGLMTGLSWLALNDNDLRGSIPTEFGYMVNMTRLILTDLLLTGTVPSELGSMTMLNNLALDANTIVGTAPREVCALRDLSLSIFVADCPFGELAGVDCPIPTCCSFCRRSEQQNTLINGIKNGNLDESGNVISGGGMDAGKEQTEPPAANSP
ncbi:hypothetical protein MPSEU_000876700 [Mayamaea pseudoterrestris]|nr:hypothetical protein MPSEU_000876700 [Mayamaea pseudoterrestris]